MGLRINTNIASINSQRNLSNNSEKLRKTLAKLSSGQRIVNAGDDAAGLSIGTNMEAQVRGLRQAERNANDGIGVVQTAEGGLQEVSNILIRLRELSVQAATDTLGNEEREFLQLEVDQLLQEVDRIAESTNFNGINLLNGTAENGEINVHVGYDAGPENVIVYDVTTTNVRVDELGVSDVDIRERDAAKDSMSFIDDGITSVNAMRSNLGAIQNRLQSTVRNLRVQDENLSEARSRIMDADVAHESSELTKFSILQQAGVATLAQSNVEPQHALRLL